MKVTKRGLAAIASITPHRQALKHGLTKMDRERLSEVVNEEERMLMRLEMAQGNVMEGRVGVISENMVETPRHDVVRRATY